ncbi:hypothetical protein LC55x_5280 [Lysobacter capsici]|uniref:DUF3489 domain-containing protein n=1 Tax=Lysobacter capsici TaxID=435897 RepID=UPI0007165428|nr:DUF3489 domain-containing protein [Lysobacter capsici]ALN88526.1 hypothetical protein LC55x_5280 [Lysobacter capsici]
MTQPTDSQRALILLAIDTGGRIENYPDNLKGGARGAVVRGLLREDLIAADGSGYALTAAGYEAVDQQPPASEEGDLTASGGDDADSQSGEADTDTAVADADDADSDASGSTDDADEQDSNGSDAGDASPEAAEPPTKRKETRIDQVVALLMRSQGVTIKEVMAATDWQQHSVRGFFAGTLKKKGYQVMNEKNGKEDRVYRIKTEEAVTTEVASEEEE